MAVVESLLPVLPVLPYLTHRSPTDLSQQQCFFLSYLPTPANPDSLANLRNPSNLRHHRHTVLSTATLANLRTLVAYCHLLFFVFQTLQKQPVQHNAILHHPTLPVHPQRAP